MATDVIAPSEIQSELSRIWDSLEGANKTRASLFNLIFFTKKKARGKYIRTVAENVIEKFPSRVIFVTSDTESSEEYLNTRVNVLSSSRKQSDIACDFIEIEFSNKAEKKVPFVILPHILPDLPIYAIWSEDPNDASPLFLQLQKLATRLIFDSESVSDLAAFAKTLVALEKNNQCAIADLNWARTEGWRTLITSTFYTNERLDTLKRTSTIQILYNAQETLTTCHTQFQALYLQGWLSTQLGWKLEKVTRDEHITTLLYNKEDGHVTITLYPEFHEQLKGGTILSVDISTEEQDHFSFGCNLETPHHVSMRFSTLEKCDIPLRYIFAKDESGQSLVKEICHKGTSRHYLNLLENIQNQKGLTPCEP